MRPFVDQPVTSLMGVLTAHGGGCAAARATGTYLRGHGSVYRSQAVQSGSDAPRLTGVMSDEDLVLDRGGVSPSSPGEEAGAGGDV